MMFVEQIAEYLDAQCNDLTYEPNTTGGNVFLSICPDRPDTCVFLRLTGGAVGYVGHSYDKLSVEAVVRAADPDGAESLAWKVYDILNGADNRFFATGGDWVVSCRAVPPASTRTDANGRHEYSIGLALEVNNSRRK